MSVDTMPLERILCVEDDPDIRAVAELALTEVGEFTVEMCESGAEALEKVEAFRPDLVMLDVMMPGMDGPETLKALQKRPGGFRAPVIFMTARLQPEEIEEYRALGSIGVIAKPFDPMMLAEQIRELVSGAT